MNKGIVLMLALLVILTTQSCVLDDVFDCEHGRGEVISETFTLSDFDEIRLHMDADVYLTQGDEFVATVYAQANILDELDFRVRNNYLRIDNDRCIRKYDPIEIFITMPDLTALSISGSGSIQTEDVFAINDIDLSISGSGDMDLLLDADDVKATISGSGDMVLEGIANDLDFRVSGSGDLHAFLMPVDRANIVISGSGNAEVYVNDILDVRVSGSGDVYFKGDPAIDSSVSGSGKIVDAN